MTFRWGLVVVAAALAGPAWSADRMITRPDWLERPTPEAFSEHYPKLARALEVEGQAQISCKVTDKGRLEACRVDSEGPDAFGFGRAAVPMSGGFKMKPQTIDGEAVSGGVVCIPIRFVLPPAPPPADLQPAPTRTEIRDKALRLVEAQAVAMETAQEEEFAELLAEPDPEADLATREAAVKALRAASARHAAGLRQAMADAVAGALSPEEMEAMSAMEALASGPDGRRPDLSELTPEISSRVSAYLSQEVRVAFCALSSCTGAPAELAAVAAAAPPPTVELERWARTPSPAQQRSAVPASANLLGVSGSARLTCDAAPDGTLKACVVAAEAPAGWKYGQAAVRLANRYRAEPAVEGAASVDRSVTLRIHFPPPPTPQVKAPPAARSPGAKAMARKLVEVSDPQGMIAAQAPGVAEGLARTVDPALAPQVEAAVRTALPRAIDRVLDDLSNLMGAEYDEATLTAVYAFHTSPAGRSVAAKVEPLQAAIETAVRRTQARVAAEARAAFCTARNCGLSQVSMAASPEASTRKP